ncbi:MAG: DUF4126 domain-containing protein [Rhodospirillales bacterium]
MTLLALAFLIGVVAGLRAMTAPAAVSWAAHLGRLPLEGSGLGWLAAAATPWIFTALAAAELVTDQLPRTPSRKTPMQFGTRIVSGALCGAAIGAGGGMPVAGAVAGALGAIAGTLGGAHVRSRLARGFGGDRPAALVEDAAAIAGAVLIVASLP